MFEVKIRSIVDRSSVNPLCSTLQCARSWSRTLFSRTVANTFPGFDRSDIPLVLPGLYYSRSGVAPAKIKALPLLKLMTFLDDVF